MAFVKDNLLLCGQNNVPLQSCPQPDEESECKKSGNVIRRSFHDDVLIWIVVALGDGLDVSM